MGTIAQLEAACVDFSDFAKRHAKAEPEVVVHGDFRPEMFLPGGEQDPREFATELGALLANKGIYSRAGMVWYHDVRARTLHVMKPQKFVYWMLDHVNLRATDQRGRMICAKLGGEAAGQILEAPQFLNALPEIHRVSDVRLPVLRKGKKLELLPVGYDAETRVLTLDGVDLDEGMAATTAISLLMDKHLAEFPWPKERREETLAVMLSAMLAPFCELLVPAFSQRPAFIFRANTEGSGKTLGARYCLAPVHGKLKITPPPEKRGDELKKMLGSAALSGESYLLFDNWKGQIGGPALEAFITSNIWADRLLGASELFSAEKSCLVYITANNATVTPDMRRRALFVDLFVEEVRSEDRTIKRRIDEEDIVGQRGEILSALLALIRNWVERGCERATTEHGSFARWGHVVGGIVEAAGLPCPLDTRTASSADEDLTAFEALLHAVMDGVMGETALKPGELMEKARELGGFKFLDEEKPGDGTELKHERATFGKVCSRFVGRKTSNGYRFDVSDTSRATRRYIITRA